MRRFLESNPGLRSRFSREIEFPDYSTDELVEIFGRFAAESEYAFGEGAEETLRAIFDGAERDESFGNARFARTLFEQALNAQALRLGAGDVAQLSHDGAGGAHAGGSRRRRVRSARPRVGARCSAASRPLERAARSPRPRRGRGYYAGGAPATS